MEITYGELIAKNTEIETHIDANNPMVLADKSQIQQVLLNLILNAIDAMADNAPDKRKITLANRKHRRVHPAVCLR